MLRLKRTDLSGIPDGMAAPLSFVAYGSSDGIHFANAGRLANPRLVRTLDGRLWISTEDGAATINPAQIRTNTKPPQVVVEQIVVDGKPVEPVGGRIEFRGREVQLDYAALSLAIPEAVRFKYKLEGFDRDWRDAGTRRQIVYANLSPRTYRFRVTACNEDGVWNPDGATLTFRCQPYFYQTFAFGVLVAGLLALALLGAHRFRVRELRSRFQIVLKERSRLMRELHDTVLQGFAGVIYQMEAAARQLDTSPEDSKRRLYRALEQADQSLKEARQALSSMRLSALESNTLPEALAIVGKEIVDGTSIRFDVDVSGTVRQLPYDVEANLYLIAREAVNNAMNHAKSRRILVALVYSPNKVRLSIQDDGVGFDPAAAAQKPNHWGLKGMRERASQIAAEFTVETALGRGTQIDVTVADRPKLLWRSVAG